MLPSHAINASAFTAFDWFLVVIVGISTVMALLKGFIKVFLSLLGVIVGIIAAGWYFADFARWLAQWITSYPMAEVVAYLLILAFVIGLFSLLARLFRNTASAFGLGFFDGVLGALFGLARGILLGVAVMMAAAAFLPRSPWMRDSVLAPYFLAAAHEISFVLPVTFEQQISIGATHLLQQTPELFQPHSVRPHR